MATVTDTQTSSTVAVLAVAGGLVLFVLHICFRFFIRLSSFHLLKESTTTARDAENPALAPVISALKKAKQGYVSFIRTDGLLVLLLAVGYLLLIIPGLIFTVWYGLSGLVTAFEGLPVCSAMKKSKEYTSGRFWAVGLRLLILVAISFSGLFIQLVLETFSPEIVAVIIAKMYQAVIFFPFEQSFLYLLYASLKPEESV